MKPYYNINIKAAISIGLKCVDFNDLALYEFCKDAILWEEGKPLWHDERQWKWVSYSLIKTNIPYFDYSDKTMYRMLVNLCKVGLIERCPINKRKGMVYLAIGPMGVKLERAIREFTSDKSVLDLGQNCPTPRTNLSEYSNTEYSKQKIVIERETHAQEIENKPILEQPKPKIESVQKPLISTLDIPTCEGHKIKIGSHEYPKQANGMPFIHPSLIDRIPVEKRIDLWWALYGIKQGEMKVEVEMMQSGVGDAATFAKIYCHTFLYVAVTDDRFKSKPLAYWKNKQWQDDIIDRRDKKPIADNTGIAITNAPIRKSQIELEVEDRARIRRMDERLQAEWEKEQAEIERGKSK